MAGNSTWLVTGANKGIGFALVEAILLRQDSIVIATVRNLSSKTSQKLQDLPTSKGSKLLVVKLDSSSDTDAIEAVQTLRQRDNITSIDVAIANAGMSRCRMPASLTPASELRDHFTVNAVGPLLLFQSTMPLLQASTKTPKFIVVSSIVSSMTLMQNFPTTSTVYGASKAALNFIVGRIHYENPSIVAFAVHPGWVQTELGNEAAARSGMEKAPVTVEESINGILLLIDKAEKTVNNKFFSFDQSVIPW